MQRRHRYLRRRRGSRGRGGGRRHRRRHCRRGSRRGSSGCHHRCGCRRHSSADRRRDGHRSRCPNGRLCRARCRRRWRDGGRRDGCRGRDWLRWRSGWGRARHGPLGRLGCLSGGRNRGRLWEGGGWLDAEAGGAGCRASRGQRAWPGEPGQPRDRAADAAERRGRQAPRLDCLRPGAVRVAAQSPTPLAAAKAWAQSAAPRLPSPAPPLACSRAFFSSTDVSRGMGEGTWSTTCTVALQVEMSVSPWTSWAGTPPMESICEAGGTVRGGPLASPTAQTPAPPARSP